MSDELRVIAKMDEAADELRAATQFACCVEEDGESVKMLVKAISGASAKLSDALALASGILVGGGSHGKSRNGEGEGAAAP